MFRFLEKRKQATVQWVHDPSQRNINNLKDVRREASRHFRGKEYLKAETEELETNSKIKNIRDLYRDINDFKKDYHLRTNIVKDEELNDLYSSPNIVRVIKSRRMRWVVHIARMGERRCVYMVLVGKHE